MADNRIHLDFFVLSVQCSGTHMLQGFLDSHPQITCFSEIKDRIYGNLYGRLRGKRLSLGDGMKLGTTVQSNQKHHLKNDWRFDKCILFERDAEGISQCHKRKHHTIGIHAVNDYLESNRKWVRNAKLPTLKLRYEDIVNGSESVKVMPEELSFSICDFLEVERVPLVGHYDRFGANTTKRDQQSRALWVRHRRLFGLKP